MTICLFCHQPLTDGSTTTEENHFKKGGTKALVHMGTELWSHELGYPSIGIGMSHMGCPKGDDQIIKNLQIAMSQGFTPEFCRTHELIHKVQE